MPAFRDRTGEIINNWKIIEFTYFDKHGASHWVCECMCENHTRAIKTISQAKQRNQCRICASKEKMNDLFGQTFGRWTAIGHSYSRDGYIFTPCQCSCEKHTQRDVRNDRLKNEESTSCGCYALEKKTTAFGESRTRLYHIWDGMIRRCYDENNPRYQNYGARGVKVCDDWLDHSGYLQFKEWAIQNGYNENLTIERINVNGNYEPTNCCWITMDEQAKNKTNTVYYQNGDNKITVVELSKKQNMKYETVKRRVLNGVSEDKLFNYLQTNNTSGVTGVTWSKQAKKYRSYINYNKKRIELGYFNEFDDAVRARLIAEYKMYGLNTKQKHLFSKYGIITSEYCEVAM